MTTTSNPAVVKVIDTTPRQVIKQPGPAVVERQDPDHTERDYLGALVKVTQRRDEQAS
jgi:hypothetical protein